MFINVCNVYWVDLTNKWLGLINFTLLFSVLGIQR